MIEYALLAALISVALIVILGQLSTSIEGIFTDVKTALDGATS
jgi:Flp pilus assembly pilin Flp